jgi:hypothetical protein
MQFSFFLRILLTFLFNIIWRDRFSEHILHHLGNVRPEFFIRFLGTRNFLLLISLILHVFQVSVINIFLILLLGRRFNPFRNILGWRFVY